MKIDAHHHFWDYSAEEYGWIGEGMEVLKRDFGPSDLKPLIDAAGIEGVISVQARTDGKENDFLCGHAAESDYILGVVGWVDLTRGDAAEQVARFSEMPKVVGLREVLQGMEDDRYCLREDFNRGVKWLHDFGLVYDILIFHQHLPHAIEMVDRHPTQVFVLDHVAKPDISSSTPDGDWVKNMKALAERENVYCKVSGMVTEVTENLEWTPELLRPYFDTVLEAFGPRRLMFGSDWPVCLLQSKYRAWVECVEGWTRDLSGDEQADVWGGTAARAYGLSE